jgi:hypothetical protein
VTKRKNSSIIPCWQSNLHRPSDSKSGSANQKAHTKICGLVSVIETLSYDNLIIRYVLASARII